jgi:hypothetical protein
MSSNQKLTTMEPRRVDAPPSMPLMEPKKIHEPIRERPIHLRRLKTIHANSHQRQPFNPYPERLESPFCESPSTPSSVARFAIPSLPGVRQYHRENDLSTYSLPQLGLAPLKSRHPRRPSSVVLSGFTSRFDGLQASSPLFPVQPSSHPRRSIAEESRSILLAGTTNTELTRARSHSHSSTPMDFYSRPPKRRLSDLPPRRQVKPSQDQLRIGGYAHLGNVATADVFVRALHSRPPTEDRRRDSVMSGTDDGRITVPRSDNDHIVIRARVVPISKGRRPFLIQRRFSKADIEAARPAPTAVEAQTNRDREENNDKSESEPANRAEGSKSERAHRQDSLVQLASTSSPQPKAAPALPLPQKRKDKVAPTVDHRNRKLMPIRKHTRSALLTHPSYYLP